VIEAVKDKIEDAEFISVYYSKERECENAESLIEKLTNEFSNIEFELVYGGQPFYYYLASIE